MEAIETTNEASNSTTEPIIIPAQQLAAIKSTSKEVRNGILLPKLFRPTYFEKNYEFLFNGPVCKKMAVWSGPEEP